MTPPVDRPTPNLPTHFPPASVNDTAFSSTTRSDGTLAPLLAMIRRHRFLIAACVLGGMGLAALYTALSHPVYDATSILRIESEQVNLPQLVQLVSTENRISTEIEVLQDRSAARAVVDSLGLRAHVTSPRRARTSALLSMVHIAPDADTATLFVHARPEGTFTVTRRGFPSDTQPFHVGDSVRIGGIAFALAAGALKVPEFRVSVVSTENAVRDLRSRLSVSRPGRDADLIAIRVKGGDPREVAASANLLAEQVISGRRDLQLSRSGSNIRFLQQQLDTLGRELRIAEDTLRAYREKEGVVDPAEAARTQVGRLAQVQADRGALDAERQALARLLQQVRSDSAKAAPGGASLSRTLMSFPTLFKNQAASELFGALATVENERAALLVRRKPEDPDVQVLTNRIAELDAQLKGIAETYLQGLTNQVDALKHVADGFGTALDSLPRKEVLAARREREVKVQQDLYTLIQTRLKEAQITQAMEDPTVRIVDAAVVPDRPVRPRPAINIVLGLLFGSIVGLGASLGRTLTDRSVRSRADALLGSGLPVLGAIPRVDRRAPALLRRGRRERQKTSPGIVLGRGPTTTGNVDPGTGRAAARIRSLLITQAETAPAYAEALNQLHANMTLAYRETPLKTIAITSPLPGEGKTLTSINFALTVAARGVRVLLIDGDLRRGLVNSVFGCARKPGFAELLANTARPEQCLRRIPVGESGTLTVMPSGTLFHTPGPLLKLERVRQLLDMIAPQFEFVIIDTPPVNLLADAALLGSASDAVLLVVRAGYTGIDTLQYAMDQLIAARAPVIGTVLNDIDLRRHGDDDASYRYLTEVERYYQAGREPAGTGR